MNTDKYYRINLKRRASGVAVALAPLALLVASFLAGFFRGQQSQFSGIGFMIAAAAIAAVNLHTSFIRPWLFSRRSGSMDGYRHISGFPLVGTILLSMGALIGFGATGSALIGAAVYALDTGGIAWFVIGTWRDRSLWDGASG